MLRWIVTSSRRYGGEQSGMLMCLKIIFSEKESRVSEIPNSKMRKLRWGKEGVHIERIPRVREIRLILYIPMDR